MKVQELRGVRADSLALRFVSGGFRPALPVGTEVQLFRDRQTLMLTSLGVGAQARAVTGSTAETTALAHALVDTPQPVITWLARCDEAAAVVTAHRLHRRFPVPELEIALDDKVIADLRRHHPVGSTVADAASWLAEHCLLEAVDGGARALVCGTREGELDTFRILGDRVAVDVRLLGGRYRVVRVAPGRATKDLPVSLLEGPIRFTDLTANAGYSAEARHALEEAVQRKDSYLSIWKAYSDLETESLDRLRDRVGRLPYTAVSATDRGYRFHLERTAGLDLRLDELPELDVELEVAQAESSERGAARGRPPSGPVRKVDLGEATLDLLVDRDECLPPPEKGTLVLSAFADERRIKRRVDAESRLRLGNCPMPWVGLMLEGLPSVPPRYKKVAPRGPSARASGARLTTAQLQAVDIGLNTPDVALIQGPPGTGKTEVIKALQERIAELAAEGQEPPRILVTSAQHDTVEHLVQRSDVFGLPALKVGVRRSGVRSGLDPIERFCDERLDTLQALTGDLTESEQLRRARDEAVSLMKAKLPAAETARLLRRLLREVAHLISPRVHDEALERARVLERPGAFDVGFEERKARFDAVHALSTTSIAFEDGGARRALVALTRLGDLATPEERDVLEACGRWDAEDPNREVLATLLERAAQVKADLLDRLVAASTPGSERLPERDDETQRVVCTVLTEVKDRLATTRQGESAIVARWLHDLEWEREAVRDGVRHYASVLASTLQHAAGRDMTDARGGRGVVDFGTVVVDEAARCHPLDLFIPMTMATRRIILVGDQRQLPHMLEPDVERDMVDQVERGDCAAETLEALKKSLFARLWAIAGERQAEDQVARRITLDTQFRMHPVLGDFVSRVFYERHGQPAIQAGRPADALTHAIAGFCRPTGAGAVACFIDVPGGPGAGESRGAKGRSFKRVPEARVIAREIQQLLLNDDTATIGVIAFYRDQVAELMREFESCGLAERAEDGTVQLSAVVSRRVEMNTVDAFQGKEFDVVFLSVVRSNAAPSEGDRAHRSKYGHLLIENRLCVAMSRQKRLLVVVGDLAFARAALPLTALTEFITLCEGPHGIIR